jgi:nucleoid-associated protein YgaU
MGLFDFVRNIGKKVFNSDAEAAEKIKAEIESTNPGVSNLGVEYEAQSGTVKLSGNAESAAAMQKAVLMAGNVQGVSQIEGAELQHPPEPGQVEYYIIEQGDTLSKIAQQFYGDANKYPRIFEENREVIKDANLIFPGQKIRIPLEQP